MTYSGDEVSLIILAVCLGVGLAFFWICMSLSLYKVATEK